MTVNTTKITSGPYTGNGIADTFSYTFKVDTKTQLSVYETTALGIESLLVVDTDYTVSGIGNDAGGTILRKAGALPTNYKWYIRSNYQLTQLTAFSSQGAFFPELHESAMDKMTLLIQQMYDKLSRNPQISESYVGTLPLSMDSPVAGLLTRWKGDLSGLENFSLVSNALVASGQLMYFPNIAAMVADTSGVLVAGMNVITQGGVSTGDGKGAFYIVVSPQALGANDKTLANGNIAVRQVRQAEQISYDNTTSGLVAVESQSAIDELKATADALGSTVDKFQQSVNSSIVLKNYALGMLGRAKSTASGFNGKGAINVIGDSISHGSFALNLFENGWTRLLGRMFNAENQSTSYGFTPYINQGSGPTLSTDVHTVSFNGTWTDTGNGGESLSGLVLTNALVGSYVQLITPFFQNRATIWYVTQPGGGTFNVQINGAVVATINTNGAANYFTNVEVAMVDAGYGDVTIKIINTVAGVVGFAGISYFSAVNEATLNNFSTSGRQLTNMSDAAIVHVCQNSSVLIMALGHNDSASATFTQKIDKLIEQCNANAVKLFVPDFRWTVSSADAVRMELKRLVDKVKGATYIPLPDYLKIDGSTANSTHLITTLGMWVDASHPNVLGNQWIAETLASVIGLSCSSKKDALEYHDYWFPLKLNAGVSIENSLRTSISTVSSFRRQGKDVVVKCYLEYNPSGAFPVGGYAIQSAWPVKAATISGAQGITAVAVIRGDTGAIVSDVSASAGGAITLNVRSSWINDQTFTFSMPLIG